MNSEKLLNAMGSISDELIEDAVITEGKKSPHHFWIRWGAMAACLCLILGCLFGYNSWKNQNSTIIYGYESQSGNMAIIPRPGEVLYCSNVYDAREHYRGQNVSFLLAIDLSSATYITEAEKAAEYQRLEEAGYRLYESKYWTYSENSKKEYHTVVVGLFTEKELSNFKVNPRYGYSFRFVTNQDGSHVNELW